MEGSEGKAKMRKGKGEEEVKRIERPTSLIQDMSDPFEDFPHTQPFDCVNITQRFFNLFSKHVRIQSFFILSSTSHPEAWTFVCVNNPEFNDIAREVYENKVQNMVIGLMLFVRYFQIYFQFRPGRLGCQSIWSRRWSTIQRRSCLVIICKQ